LVVDDIDDNLTLLRDVLESRYALTTARNGKEALRLAAGELAPELILLDIRMPGMDGFEVMRRLRANPLTASIPVIFLSALASPEDEETGLELGAVDFIHKPINPSIALARIRNHLAVSGSTRKLRALADQLGRYVAPQVCQSLLDGSRDAEIRTQQKKLTVFFSDIKDFTASTARWKPEDVTFLLNSYFSEMSRIADQYGGTLDKFIGDAMLIFFGDPGTRGPREDALQCVRMAQAMQRRMTELQLLWRELGADKAFQIRIGINTGDCNVGNFGCDTRMDYTIIGPPVNLAARLEEAAAPGGIVISRETYELVQSEVSVDATGPLHLKGFADPVNAYVLRDEAAVPAVRALTGWPASAMQFPMLPRDRALVAQHAASNQLTGSSLDRRSTPERATADHMH
jgi:class 3 adenylate cyclase